jgi:hypothetical protein
MSVDGHDCAVDLIASTTAPGSAIAGNGDDHRPDRPASPRPAPPGHAYRPGHGPAGTATPTAGTTTTDTPTEPTQVIEVSPDPALPPPLPGPDLPPVDRVLGLG